MARSSPRRRATQGRGASIVVSMGCSGDGREAGSGTLSSTRPVDRQDSDAVILLALGHGALDVAVRLAPGQRLPLVALPPGAGHPDEELGAAVHEVHLEG